MLKYSDTVLLLARLTSFCQSQFDAVQEPRPESLLFLNEVTRKIKTHLNDKRIARQCAKREGKAAKSRQWCPSADMWLKGTVAVETAAPIQDEEAAKPKVCRLNHSSQHTHN